MRIRHARGTGSASPAFDVCTDTATSAWAVSAVCVCSPASVIVPTVLAFACLSTSTKGWDRWAKSL
ncbi:Uncharacterised protein [Mycobacterium tuberculosis]|nr:Uncharacterised protein [Mycobacterium tuberculosis]